MSIVTVRNDTGTKQSYEFAWDPSGSIRGNLADNTDTTWANGVGVGNRLKLSWQSVSVAANQKIKAIRFRCRVARSASATGAIDTLKVASITWTNGSIGAVDAFTTATVTWQEFVGAWRTTTAGGYTWTPSGLEVTGVQLVGTSTFLGSSWPRVSAVYMDVDLNTQPTVGSVAVTGYTTTSQPLVSWAYADTESDPQTQFQVRVFSAAQLAVSGFDPATSAATWDSGTLSGSDANTVIGTPLGNGTTYTAYVRAAQDLNGTPWWSNWAASTPVTVVLTTPPAPDVTATVDNDRLRVGLEIRAHANMLGLEDASFGSTAGTWVNEANATLARSTTVAYDGVASLRLTASASGTMRAATAVSASATVAPGATYTALARFRPGSTARGTIVQIRWLAADGTTVVATSSSATVTESGGTWTAPVRVVATCPTAASRYQVVIQVVSAASAELHYVDTVLLAPGDVADWSAGGQVASSAIVVECTDTASAPGNLAQPQLASAGEELQTTAGFAQVGTGSLVYDDSPGLAWTGEGAITWAAAPSTTARLLIGWDTASPFDETYALPASRGDTYTLGLWARALANATSWTLKLTGYAADGTTSGANTTAQTSVNVSTDWGRCTLSWTAAAADRYVLAELTKVTDATIYQVAVDGISWELGATASDWVPGQGLAPDWRAMRGWEEALPVADSASQIFGRWDATAIPRVPRRYRARIELDTPDGIVASAQGAATSDAVALAAVSEWWLRDPDAPWQTAPVLVTAQDTAISEDTEVLRPRGRDEAVVVSGVVGGLDGSIEIVTIGEAAWQPVLALLRAPRPLLLSAPDETRTIRLIGERQIAEEGTWGKRIRTARVGYVAVSNLG